MMDKWDKLEEEESFQMESFFIQELGLDLNE